MYCGFVGIVLIALIAGHVGAGAFLWVLRDWWQKIEKEDLDPDSRPVPVWVTGGIERAIFSLPIAYLPNPQNVSLIGAGMIAWLALKMATNWNRIWAEEDEVKRTRRTRGALAALLAGVVSLSFAVWGGLSARGVLWPCYSAF